MTPIRPDANNNPRARSESPPPAAAQAPASSGRQPSRIGVGAGQVGQTGEGGELLRRSPSPDRQRPAEAPTASAPEAASEAAAQWRSSLSTAPRAVHWNDLAACRAVLLRPMADPQTRGIGERLVALQRRLMTVEGTGAQFAKAAHQIDNDIQAHTDMPSQAALIAYADLQVQWQTAERRWPRAAPEPGPPGTATEA